MLMTEQDFMSHNRQITWLHQELKEGPRRVPPMPPEQIKIHKLELSWHMAALVFDNIIELEPRVEPGDLAA
jgi:hypothetical protein